MPACGAPAPPARWFGASPSPLAVSTWPGREGSGLPGSDHAQDACRRPGAEYAGDQCAQDRSGRAAERTHSCSVPRNGTESAGGPPGEGWAYNDVRVNLTALALTVLFRRALPDVLRDRVMAPVGASSSWSWHGYEDSFVDVDGTRVPVVSGGAHWGGGLWISALDLARIGQLCLRGGRWGRARVVSAGWIEQMWTPCRVKPNYGLSWWLNDHRTVWPSAPATGRCARGNGGGHLLWVDPARDLVISSRWGAGVESLLAEVSRAVSAGPRGVLPGAGGPA
ncbi:serine hydrolase domain-containing protein [Streptomyces sp. NPDC021212]|uniref:serine hydrolase domain-containing protein n=1 Tax=Streptomyces sp. NPDC021212 TaxID=3365118 RepID=UPI00378EC215